MSSFGMAGVLGATQEEVLGAVEQHLQLSSHHLLEGSELRQAMVQAKENMEYDSKVTLARVSL